MARNKENDVDDDEDEVSITPSELDELTHAELCMLYRESTETMRFVKTHQWKTVGATLLTFAGLIFTAGFVDANQALTDKFMAITILLTTAVIFTLVIYQFWQANETAKIETMNGQFSSLYRKVRAQKSSREGNLHRYTLLFFMITVIVLGAVVVHLALARIAIT